MIELSDQGSSSVYIPVHALGKLPHSQQFCQLGVCIAMEATVAALSCQIIKLQPACPVCQRGQHHHSGALSPVMGLLLLPALLKGHLLTMVRSWSLAAGMLLLLQGRMLVCRVMVMLTSGSTAGGMLLLLQGRMQVCRVMVVLTSGSTAVGVLLVLSGQKLTCEQPVTKVVHLSVAAAVKDAGCTDLFRGISWQY